MVASRISFGKIEFDDIHGQLLCEGKPIAISQRASALLGALIKANGQAVSKTELMEKAWPHLIVEEGNLTVQIAALRKALGTDVDGNDWIVTVPRVGYRLLQQQSRVEAAIEHSVLPSLAVLPFQNLSGDVEQDYFADGVVEDIITALSRFKSFAVIARNSTFVYKGRNVDVRQVASELAVKYVLVGSIRRHGERLRITAQLVDGLTRSQLWAESFDGQRQDVFDFQDRITESVVAVVEPKIQQTEIERSRRERPGSPVGYDLYLEAMALQQPGVTPEKYLASTTLLAKVLKVEPNNPTYLASAAHTLNMPILKGWNAVTVESRQSIADYVERALAVAGDDANVLAVCANTLVQGLKQYGRGLELAGHAVFANPYNFYAVIVAGTANLHCGDIDAALQYYHRAIRLNPRDRSTSWAQAGIAHAQMIRGDYHAALHWVEKSLALNPHYSPAHWMLIAEHVHLGNIVEAQRFLAEFRQREPAVTIASIQTGQPAKDPSRMAAILEGLRLAGLPEA